MNYKQHHKEVTVDLHKIINRLMYMYTLWIFFTEQQLMYLGETIRMMKGPMEMQMQVVQVQEQVGTTNKNDPNNTNAHNYDALTYKNQSRSAVKCREEIQMFHQKVLKTSE